MAYKNKESQKAWREANKESIKIYRVKYYQENRERLLVKGRENQKKLRKKRRAWINELKSHSKCIICGEDRGPCLDFHHLDPSLKVFEINRINKLRVGSEAVLEELKKCVVICSNCHRLFHAGLVEIPKVSPKEADLYETSLHRPRSQHPS